MSDYVCGCGSEEIVVAICAQCEEDDMEQADKNIERINKLEEENEQLKNKIVKLTAELVSKDQSDVLKKLSE